MLKLLSIGAARTKNQNLWNRCVSKIAFNGGECWWSENNRLFGKGGHNIKLAGKLTGYEIDVYRESEDENIEEDIDLDEFTDEIDSWIIDELKGIGCDTAKSVLNIPDAELVRRTELEEETIAEIKQILKAEFE